MPETPNREPASWVALLVIGTSLNTIGIAFSGLGVFRYILMGAGLLLLLTSVVKLARSAPRSKDPPTSA